MENKEEIGKETFGSVVKLNIFGKAFNKIWIGSDCGSDRIGLVFSLLVQKNHFEKTSNRFDSDFFFRAACVTN